MHDQTMVPVTAQGLGLLDLRHEIEHERDIDSGAAGGR